MLYGEINRQRLKIINEHVVADTIDYLEARFAFSEDWDGLEKWVHFAKDGEVYDIRLTDDCIRKEDHLNLSAGIWKVYLHGNEFSGGKVIERITTNAAILKVEPTGALNGEPFPEMPASVTEQILARLEDVEQNGGGSGGGISRETDPTVPDWAKQPEKPKYTSAEVGAVSAEQFNQLSEAKVNLPTNEDGTPNHGTAGYYAVSDGAGGIKWVASGNTGGTDEPVTPPTHGIVWDLVNVTSSNPVTSVADGVSLSAVLTAADGYTLGDVTVTMGGEVLAGVWDANTSTVTIASVTGDVIISCVGVEQGTGEVIDTSPVIAQYDVGYRKASSAADVTLTAKNGLCVTKKYPYELDVNALMDSVYYDAENNYITNIVDLPWVGIYTPNTKYLAAGNTTSGLGTHNKTVMFVGDEFLKNFSASNTSYTTGSPALLRIGLVNDSQYMATDGVAFTLFAADIDDSYAYWSRNGNKNTIFPKNVRDGDIIFAGKNTPYYGMANIDGTMVGGGSASAISVDADYAMDYGVSAANLVTDNAGTNLAGNLDTAYAEVIEEAKNAWLSECNGNIDKIPLIIHTDQHTNFNKDLFDFISNIVDWYDVGKVINLGDTVNSYGDASNLLSNANLENYIKSMASVPYSKRIEVYGNHDTWGDGESQGMTPQNHLYKYFRNIYARRFDNYGNFVTYDDNYNVKYVVVSGFAYDFDIGEYSHYFIPSDSIDKIIAELEKADGYDVIILSHVPLGTETTTVYNSLDGTAEEKSVGGVNFKLLTDLWAGRKAKTAGSVTDEYGNSHDFDFTKCDGELLCGLHGHVHADGYYYIGGLLDVYFDAYYISPKAIHFVIVDRENRRLNVWKVDDSPAYQNYQIPLDNPTE